MTKEEFINKLIITAEKNCNSRKLIDDLYREKTRIEGKSIEERSN